MKERGVLTCSGRLGSICGRWYPDLYHRHHYQLQHQQPIYKM